MLSFKKNATINLTGIIAPFSSSHKCSKGAQFKQLPLLPDSVFQAQSQCRGNEGHNCLQANKLTEYFCLTEFIPPSHFCFPSRFVLNDPSLLLLNTVYIPSRYCTTSFTDTAHFFLNFQFPSEVYTKHARVLFKTSASLPYPQISSTALCSRTASVTSKYNAEEEHQHFPSLPGSFSGVHLTTVFSFPKKSTAASGGYLCEQRRRYTFCYCTDVNNKLEEVNKLISCN